jgi:hypothetical protein
LPVNEVELFLRGNRTEPFKKSVSIFSKPSGRPPLHGNVCPNVVSFRFQPLTLFDEQSFHLTDNPSEKHRSSWVGACPADEESTESGCLTE